MKYSICKPGFFLEDLTAPFVPDTKLIVCADGKNPITLTPKKRTYEDALKDGMKLLGLSFQNGDVRKRVICSKLLEGKRGDTIIVRFSSHPRRKKKKTVRKRKRRNE